MSTSRILLLIGGFILLTFGSFIYFVATWDREKEQPVSQAPVFSSPQYSGVWGNAPATTQGDVL
ncbi:hypothetical protein [Algirhabdus cladophorae]|uniref:hypothetical protein n=1 Tax=Algirhabdus cladophorae TaxID=3377108 RepID=UPI003B847942